MSIPTVPLPVVEPTPKRHVLRTIVLSVMGMLLLALIILVVIFGPPWSPPPLVSGGGPGTVAGAVPAKTHQAPTTPPDSNASTTVVYEVVGDGPARINCSDCQGDISVTQSDGAILPWRKTVHTAYSTGSIPDLSIIAQRMGDGSGTITARVIIGGHVVSENTSTGADVTVTASGSNSP